MHYHSGKIKSTSVISIFSIVISKKLSSEVQFLARNSRVWSNRVTGYPMGSKHVNEIKITLRVKLKTTEDLQ